MRKVRLVFLTIGIFLSLGSYSQSVTPATLNATGGTNFFTFYRFEWSFGEAMAITTMDATSSNLIVTNGVLQPGTHNPATINNTSVWDRLCQLCFSSCYICGKLCGMVGNYRCICK